MTSQPQINHNISAHDRVARRYEAIHGEIFNTIEQDRLRRKLAQAFSLVRTGRATPVVLDYGCGTGNLTRHLLDLGADVVAADVSPECLRLVQERHGAGGRVQVLQIGGEDLREVQDGRLDLAGAYSVLHHVPDYLKAVGDMARVVRTGGIIYIDHERNRSFWNPTPEYQEFQRLGRTRWLRLTGPEGWRKFLRPSNYLMKLRRLRDRRYTFEGDIHVWPDDHIEWDLVERQLKECGCKVLLKEEYLLYQRGYRLEVYQRFKDRCADMCLLVAGKR